jgi:hypothetical protein
MALIISSIDTTLKIPPMFRGLTGAKPLEISFIKGEPTEVSKKIAEYYTANWAKKFKYAHQPEPEPFYKPGEINNELPSVFDPEAFLQENFNNISQAVSELKKKELNEICKVLRLKDYVTQSAERLRERITNDIETKLKQEEELNKNKPAQGEGEE